MMISIIAMIMMIISVIKFIWIMMIMELTLSIIIKTIMTKINMDNSKTDHDDISNEHQ